MSRLIYLVCGVPGAGKSWVCEQLTEKFDYIKHDDYRKNYLVKLVKTAMEISDKPILADCPFAERELRDNLVRNGADVVPIFIVEHPSIVKARYEARKPSKAFLKSFESRAASIGNRAKEWNAFSGTSEEVLKHLQQV